MRLLVGNITTQVITGGKDNLLTFDVIKKLKIYLSYKVDGYQHSTLYKERKWDGTKSMLKYKKFPTGLLPYVLKFATTNNIHVDIEDVRENLITCNTKKEDWITKFGSIDIGVHPYEHQLDSAFKCIKYVGGIPFYRGIIDLATNSGKTGVIAGLHANLGTNMHTILIVDNVLTFNKSVKEFSEWFKVGQISSKKYDIQPFTIAMVGTLSNRLKKSVNTKVDVSKFQVYLVDEAHSAGSATHTFVASCIPASVRLYFSGTPLDTKNKEHNLKLIGNSGPTIATITNREMMDKGVSVPTEVIMNVNLGLSRKTYEQELEDRVFYSDKRVNKMIEIIELEEKGKQILITFNYHNHGLFLLESIQKALPNLSIAMVHGETKDRERIIDDFANKDIQVLIGSTIMRQALNIPAIEVIIMGIGGKDKITIKQFLGRGIRINKNQTVLKLYDWFDVGQYVGKHSRYRIQLYKKEKLPITFTYKHNGQYSPIL